MEALVKSFHVPHGIEMCLVHDGSTGYSYDSYVAQARFVLPDGNVLCANHAMNAHHYLTPEGGPSVKSVHEVVASLCGQIWYDYTIWLGRGASPLHMVLDMEPDRRKLARAY